MVGCLTIAIADVQRAQSLHHNTKVPTDIASMGLHSLVRIAGMNAKAQNILIRVQQHP